jgi:hypothetical protein
LEAVLGKPECLAIRNGLTAATAKVLTIKYDEVAGERTPVLQAASLQHVPQK